MQADHLVGLGHQVRHRVGRRHRHRQHQPLRVRPADGAECRAHRRPCGDAVIDQDGRASLDRHAGAAAEIYRPAAFQFLDLPRRLLPDPRFRRQFHQIRIENGFNVTTVGDSADSQLRLERRADLPYEHEVERRLQRPRHLQPDGDTAPWQGQHDRSLVAKVHQSGRQAQAGVASVFKLEMELEIGHAASRHARRPRLRPQPNRPITRVSPSAVLDTG